MFLREQVPLWPIVLEGRTVSQCAEHHGALGCLTEIYTRCRVKITVTLEPIVACRQGGENTSISVGRTDERVSSQYMRLFHAVDIVSETLERYFSLSSSSSSLFLSV